MDPRASIEAAWRTEWPRLVASITRLLGDVGRAEEIAQDAVVAALERWPHDGVPDRPGAWLMAVARNRAIDRIRRERARGEHHRQPAEAAAEDSHAPEAIGDDLLALVFVTCLPVLRRESRVALTLRLLGGLTTEEIARAFLVSSPAIGQRISRAKRTLADARVPFEIPQEDELPARLSAVLEVVYLVFNEGYSASTGAAWIRLDLAREALRLGRELAGLLPRAPEVHGLVALMELQASRFEARMAPDGSPVPLPDQNRGRWDPTRIAHGLAALDRAVALRRRAGPYTLQAAIAACHARAPSFEETDWEAIVALYDALLGLAPSPIVALNRAIAVLHADGPEAALAALDAITGDPRLAPYHLLGATRADVLLRLGRDAEADEELRRAAALAPTERERELLCSRADERRAPVTGHRGIAG